MTYPEISVGLARRSDVVGIAVRSRDLIEKGLQWSWTPRRVAASVRSPTAIVVVARAATRIAGFGIMRYGDDEAHLDLLAVDPDYRRAGLGRRLLEWLEKPALVARHIYGVLGGARVEPWRTGVLRAARLPEAHAYRSLLPRPRVGHAHGARAWVPEPTGVRRMGESN